MAGAQELALDVSGRSLIYLAALQVVVNLVVGETEYL